ncbi:neural/ectodermal development factor IMP-L2 isoform X2 [Anoplolepis gracilipes]|uniref:neural/ectodermal development factor IMP-L2 isoform X2 n=1 Tax=Anoplolepis gracilipes TaxID=354296 RepID=UPI003B9E4AC0
MRLYLSNFAHLLVIVAVSSVTLGNPLAFLLLNTSYTRANVDQSIATNRLTSDIKPAGERKHPGFTSTWTSIIQNPPDSLEAAVGSRVELQCEVTGTPPPQVYWITGNEPERQIQELTMRVQEVSNAVSMDREFAQISSTYVIDCVRPEDQGLKYCVSVSENIVAQSTATVLLVNTTRTTVCSSESQPTITLHSPWRFAIQRKTVILPCRAAGQPAPYLFWIDNMGNTISLTTHTRHTVLANGDLQITDLEWGDMGQYTCKVQSGYTEKSVSTFLYPVGNEPGIRQTEIPA